MPRSAQPVQQALTVTLWAPLHATNAQEELIQRMKDPTPLRYAFDAIQEPMQIMKDLLHALIAQKGAMHHPEGHRCVLYLSYARQANSWMLRRWHAQVVHQGNHQEVDSSALLKLLRFF